MKRPILTQLSLLATMAMVLATEIPGAGLKPSQPQMGEADRGSQVQKGSLTIEENTLSQKAVTFVTAVSEEAAATDGAVGKPVKGAAQLSYWWWLLLPLLGFLSLLWLLVRKGSSEVPPELETVSPEGPAVPPAPDFAAPIAPATTAIAVEPFPHEMASAKLKVQPVKDFSMADHTQDKNLQSQPLPVEEQVLSVIQEEMTVGKGQIARSKVLVHKRVETREEVVNVPIAQERIWVEHVPKHQVIEGEVPQERDENGVHIIPIFEEAAVTESRLLLREEVHISKQRITEAVSQPITLRQEVADVERIVLEDIALEGSSTPDRLVNSPPEPSAEPAVPLEVKDGERVGQATQLAAAIQVPELDPADFSGVAAAPEAAGSPESARAVSTVEEVVIPVVAEEVTLATQTVPRNKVRINTRVESREQIVEAPAMREELVIQHVPINQYVEGSPPAEREVDGVRIIPILVEEVVTRPQLVLREEVHISKRRTTETVPQTVTLRYEVVDVEEITL